MSRVLLINDTTITDVRVCVCVCVCVCVFACVLTDFSVFVTVEESCCTYNTDAQIPCDWQTELLDYPELFTHCCNYSDWSEWQPIPDSIRDVGHANSLCGSRQSYQEIRYQSAKGLGCTDRNETRWIGK